MSDQNDVAMQKQHTAAYAKKNGWKIVCWYEEQPEQVINRANKGEK